MDLTFQIAIISKAAFLVAVLTFFSGFGLGKILTSVFMIFSAGGGLFYRLQMPLLSME